MRDNYFDCPERERAQWWGDAVNELGQAFYAFDPQAQKLALKAIYELMNWQRGDGVIFSTPTGSTAYSLSAGGPVVAPGCRCLVISPLAPHNLTMRPVVVPDTSDVALRVRTRRSAVTLSLDNTAYDVADNTEIRVSLSEKRIFLGQAHNISFYDTLRKKMMWGVDIRS